MPGSRVGRARSEDAPPKRRVPRSILIGLSVALWLGLAACAHLAGEAVLPEEALPDPADPAYAEQALALRGERVRAVERATLNLEAVERLIGVRQAGRVSRDASGRIVGLSEQVDLQRWRMDLEMELLRAKGALSRLERRVRTDFQGELPSWWPRDEE